MCFGNHSAWLQHLQLYCRTSLALVNYLRGRFLIVMGGFGWFHCRVSIFLLSSLCVICEWIEGILQTWVFWQLLELGQRFATISSGCRKWCCLGWSVFTYKQPIHSVLEFTQVKEDILTNTQMQTRSSFLIVFWLQLLLSLSSNLRLFPNTTQALALPST